MTLRDVTLTANNAADVAFKGKLLHEYSTQNTAGTKERWTELRLWETEAGNWVAEKVGMSTRQNEAALRDVLVIEIHRIPGRETSGGVKLDTIEQSPDDLEYEVMKFFGWTSAAKAFAKQAGWDVTWHVA